VTKILLINGHIEHEKSEGKLNNLLFKQMHDFFIKNLYNIETTVINNGYEISEEIGKWIQSDCIIFQTPIYWFSIPGGFKSYIDQVYKSGVFYTRSDKYGDGGLLIGKTYMFSLTWNAPVSIFEDPETFYGGLTLENAIIHLHKMNEYIGMKPLPTFSLNDVVKKPNIPDFKQQLQEHLIKYF
jgi:modulator of drug activity B